MYNIIYFAYIFEMYAYLLLGRTCLFIFEIYTLYICIIHLYFGCCSTKHKSDRGINSHIWTSPLKCSLTQYQLQVGISFQLSIGKQDNKFNNSVRSSFTSIFIPTTRNINQTYLMIWSGTGLFLNRGCSSRTGCTVKHWMSKSKSVKDIRNISYSIILWYRIQWKQTNLRLKAIRWRILASLSEYLGCEE